MDTTSIARHVMVAVLVLITSCQETQDQKHTTSRHYDLEAYEFRVPIEVVWPRLIAVLVEYGFRMTGPPVAGETLSTGRNGRGYRILVHVVRHGPVRYKLQLAHQYESVGKDGSIERTIEAWNTVGWPCDAILWTLIERVDPAGAADLVASEHQTSGDR